MPADILTRIQNEIHAFSKGQKKIASYILTNYDKAAFMTASRLGKTVEVSESTVVRFAVELGYAGYPEMQKTLQELVRNKLTSVQRIQLTGDLQPNDVLRSVLKSDVSNIRATIDLIDNASFNAAINALLEAKKVYIVGLMSAAPLAQFLAYYLGFVMDNVVMVLLETVCEKLRQMTAARITASKKEGVALKNEMSNYTNTQRSIRDVLLDNENYQDCPLFKRLYRDIERYMVRTIWRMKQQGEVPASETIFSIVRGFRRR